jgi:hypothetical protein
MTKESRGPELELHSPGLHGGGSQTGTYYKVEYRTTTSLSTVIGNPNEPFPFIIDHYWRSLEIALGATPYGANIPVRRWDTEAAKHGLVSYAAAEAHRWAFLAFLEAHSIGGGLCIETRLVAVKMQQQYSTEEIGVTAHQEYRHKPEAIAPRKPKLPTQFAEAAE